MTPEQISQILDDLGQRLGPTGSHVFELAVRQVYIDGIVSIVAAIVWLALTIAFARRVIDWGQSGNSYSERGMVAFMGGLGWVIAGLLIGLLAIDSLTRLLNPEYAALHDILSAIGGAK